MNSYLWRIDLRGHTSLPLSVVLCIFLTFSALVLSNPANAEVKEFSKLKGEYLSLRNTDVEAQKLSEWQTLARKFESFAKRNKGGTGPNSLLHASILYEKLFTHHKETAYYDKAVNLLSVLIREYPKSKFADDALVRQGDLYRSRGKKDKAKAAYQRIVDEYASGDMYDVGRVRLERLDAKTDAKKSSVIKGKANWPLVVLDPGHGGEDLGAPGQGGLLEKDVVLAVAFELEKLLRETPGVRVALTRNTDDFVPLATRTKLANDANAALFLSLHANSSPGGRASGFEVYYLDNTGDKASSKLAERENASSKFEGAQGDLYFMLSDLIQNAKADDSILLANVLADTMYSNLKPKWSHVKRLRVKKAPFYVLVGAHMPCVLAELFFIDHVRDGKFLGLKEFRRDVARGLHRGVLAYLKKIGKL